MAKLKEIHLIPEEDVFEGMKQSFDINGERLLLIKSNGNIFVIENSCGHFGESLNNARVEGKEITCNHHYVKFSLVDGSVKNNVVESCDKLKIHNWKIENQTIIALIS